MNISSLLRRYKLSLLLEEVVFDDSEKKIIEILNSGCQKYLEISDDAVIRTIDSPLYKLGLYDKITTILKTDNQYYDYYNKKKIFSDERILNLINEWCDYYKTD